MLEIIFYANTVLSLLLILLIIFYFAGYKNLLLIILLNALLAILSAIRVHLNFEPSSIILLVIWSFNTLIWLNAYSIRQKDND